jgi:hypothetical protein
MKRMTPRFARPKPPPDGAADACGANKLARLSPSGERPPIRSQSRREILSQKHAFRPRGSSIDQPTLISAAGFRLTPPEFSGNAGALSTFAVFSEATSGSLSETDTETDIAAIAAVFRVSERLGNVSVNFSKTDVKSQARTSPFLR